MHLAVEDHDPHVPHMGAGHGAFLHLLHDPPLDGGQVLAVDDPAHDAVVKHQLAAPGQIDFLTAAHV